MDMGKIAERVVVGGVVGVVDTEMESWDARRGVQTTSFKSATVIYRAAAVIGGAMAESGMLGGGILREYGGEISKSASALLGKSIWAMIKGGTGIQRGVANYTARAAFSRPVAVPAPGFGGDSGIIVSST